MPYKYVPGTKTTPRNFEKIELADVIDATSLQEMMDDYYALTGIGVGIIDLKGELLGGSIGAEVSEGAGATFWFTVAMEKSSKAQATLYSAPVPDNSAGSNRPELSSSPVIRILLTEDDPTAQKIVPMLLKNYGYLVDVAVDGKDALQALETGDYQLVLMDCMMPEMNGYEVTTIIRNPASAVRRHDIPIIALTGNAMKQDRERCIAAGMDDYIPKPLVLADLLTKLEMWLKKRN